MTSTTTSKVAGSSSASGCSSASASTPVATIRSQSFDLGRMQQYYIINNITFEEKIMALFITSLAAEHYKLLTDLFAPERPMTKKYKDIC